MTISCRSIAVAVLSLSVASSRLLVAGDPIPAIPRVLPPVGIELDAGVRETIAGRLSALLERLHAIADHPSAPDVAIFTDAVSLALQFGEFYSDKDPDVALALLDAADDRLDRLAAGTSP